MEEGHPALARETKATVQRILSEAEIRPDKIRYYLERRDPDFISKMKEVLIVNREIALAAAQDAEAAKNAEEGQNGFRPSNVISQVS